MNNTTRPRKLRTQTDTNDTGRRSQYTRDVDVVHSSVCDKARCSVSIELGVRTFMAYPRPCLQLVPHVESGECAVISGRARQS